MSGTPSESEIQTIGTNIVDLLEQFRIRADGWAGVSGELDVLERSLAGEYLPSVSSVSGAFRAGLSDLVSQSTALAFLEPLIREYAKFISDNPGSGTGAGSGSDNLVDLTVAIYEHFINNSLTVESRAISYMLDDGSMTKSDGFGNAVVGTGNLARLTVDYKAHNLEACAVEKKVFRCIQDQNSGVKEEAEVFSVMGEAPAFDNLGKNIADVTGQLGTGVLGEIVSMNAGSGTGGSFLTNSSFSTYDATATPKFSGWDLSAGTAADITQDTTNTYRQYPNSSTSASLKIAASVSDTKTLKQTLANLRLNSIDPDTPYFCRIMLNKTIGTAVGGSVVIRCGSVSETITIASLAANWAELKIGTTTPKDVWAKNFNEDGFDIEIEWTQSASTGYLLVDDCIFAPYEKIDGTYWALRQTHPTAPKSWLLDDTIETTDTGGAPATAEIQYWLYRSGLGYLPHTTGTPTWPEPT